MYTHIKKKNVLFPYSWVVLCVVSIVLMLVSIPYILFGHSIEPRANMAVQEIARTSPQLGVFVKDILRVFGLSWFTWGFLSAAIALTAFRRGEKWAWYVFWIAPLYELGDGFIDYVAGGTTWIIPVIIALFLAIVLLLSPQCAISFKKQKRI